MGTSEGAAVSPAGALVQEAIRIEGRSANCVGWLSLPHQCGSVDAIELAWQFRGEGGGRILTQVEALDRSARRVGVLGSHFSGPASDEWAEGRMIVDLPPDTHSFRVFFGSWREEVRADVRRVCALPLKRILTAEGRDYSHYMRKGADFGQTFRATAERVDRVTLSVTRHDVQPTPATLLTCRLSKAGSPETIGEFAVSAQALPLLRRHDVTFDLRAKGLSVGETYRLDFSVNGGERYYGYVLTAGEDTYSAGRMIAPNRKGREYDLAVGCYAEIPHDGWATVAVSPQESLRPRAVPESVVVGAPFGSLPNEVKREIERVFAPPSVQEPDACYATPSYSTGGLTGKEMADLGIGQVLYLLYWQNWEIAPGVWNDDYINNRIADMNHRAAAGIRLAVRVGEAHPGARVWKLRRRKPYLGRNPKVYPGEEDTDERYSVFLRKLATLLKGRVTSYTLGDELDSQFGCDSYNTERLREYYEFFVKAAKVIRSIDPKAEVVMFPPGWGYERALRSLSTLCEWGYGEVGNGISINVPFRRLNSPLRLSRFVSGVKKLNASFKLYSNGVGYCMDRFPERDQAIRVFHTMFKLWDAGWSQAAYYLLGSHRHPWSSGLVWRDENGGLKKQQSWYAFQTCAHVFHNRSDARRPDFPITVESAPDELQFAGGRFEVNGPMSDVAMFAYERNRELVIVLMQYPFDTGVKTRVDVLVRSSKFRFPVRVPMLNFGGREDVDYEILSDGSMRLPGLLASSEPIILRMVRWNQ